MEKWYGMTDNIMMDIGNEISHMVKDEWSIHMEITMKATGLMGKSMDKVCRFTKMEIPIRDNLLEGFSMDRVNSNGLMDELM